MRCWNDKNLTCLEDCELVENCPDRTRMLEVCTEYIGECKKWMTYNIPISQERGMELAFKMFDEALVKMKGQTSSKQLDIITLKEIIKELENRVEDLEVEFSICGHHAICNRILECNEITDLLKRKVMKISPADYDW